MLHTTSRPARRSRFFAALAAVTIVLSGCSLFGSKAPSGPPPPPKETGLPADVPDYVLRSDASVVARSEDDRSMRVEMTSINGITSPIAYYRKTLPEQGWKITKDTAGDRGGLITATRNGKEISTTFSIKDGQTYIVIELEK